MADLAAASPRARKGPSCFALWSATAERFAAARRSFFSRREPTDTRSLTSDDGRLGVE
jgi:hypothetical protein